MCVREKWKIDIDIQDCEPSMGLKRETSPGMWKLASWRIMTFDDKLDAYK